MSIHKFKINNEEVEVDVDGDTPLLWVIRDNLKLFGTRYGCGIGQCGSCTVHLNGSPARSCLLLIHAVNNSIITTIEGLSKKGPHPVQTAWEDEDVAQCGYCQSGQIMTAAALIDDNPNPSEAEIRQAMSGNICRCGTYSRIIKAIKSIGDEQK